MGLLGHILEVTVRMKKIPSPWITYESVRVPDIAAYIVALKEAAREWPQTVGFIDCTARGKALGRGVLIKAIEDAAMGTASVYRSLELPLPRTLPYANRELRARFAELLAECMPFDLVIDEQTADGQEVRVAKT